ncbi:hypothetical protein [uncultured Sphaerochaeta sp.]|uniref:hypothetical protein n=1 Tax=uncultured Sphaerochaeta sp. TaxID=886478 RepID=UPI002A0A9113|nr:hypothetical protein [uncultured Sphaerochaeta sp.]
MNFLSRKEINSIIRFSKVENLKCLPYPNKHDRLRILSFSEASSILGFEEADFLGYVLATGEVPFMEVGNGYAFDRIELFRWYVSKSSDSDE